MDTNQQHFSYQGWEFRRETDGSLRIEPSNSIGSEVFKDQPKQQMQSVTIPADQVHRLVGYCLTGDINNTQVLQSLKKEYGLVGSGTSS